MTTLALAAMTSLVAPVSANAAVYGGFSWAAGVLRATPLVVQATTTASTTTSLVAVYRCTGVTEYPLWVSTSLTTCVANGPDYRITMTVLSNTQTSVKIEATAATCGIKTITFGSANSSCAFDLTNPNPGTVGSLAGYSPVPIAGGLVGAWTARIRFDNAVNIVGAAPLNDLFSRMTIYFDMCFDVGDVFAFKVDTDKIL